MKLQNVQTEYDKIVLKLANIQSLIYYHRRFKLHTLHQAEVIRLTDIRKETEKEKKEIKLRLKRGW